MTDDKKRKSTRSKRFSYRRKLKFTYENNDRY
nr:MAG TPA: hypothetical protein [Caudoviricetes sp.]